MKTILLVDFGIRIKQLRDERCISQERLGELAKVYRTYIGMIERGEKNITLTNIEKLAKELKIAIKTVILIPTGLP